MPFARPAPQQLRDRLAAEFEVLFAGADPRRRRSIEGVLVRVLALVSHELHGHVEWASRQMHIATADAAELPVRAAVWGITPRPATPARGPVAFSGAAGAIVPAGAELRRADDARYRLEADCTLSGPGGTGTASALATLAGTAGNAPADTALTLIEPVAGVQSAATVAAPGLDGGLDEEDVESLRARTRARIQEPPMGGAVHDYVAWVRAVVGDTRVWVYPHTPGIGEVTVRFLMPDGAIPGAATLGLVRDAIEAARPVTAAAVHVLAPAVHTVDFSIALVPDTTANRQAATAALADVLIREAEPGGTLPRSRISAAISAAPGEYSHEIVTPASAIVSPAGAVARLGSVAWL